MTALFWILGGLVAFIALAFLAGSAFIYMIGGTDDHSAEAEEDEP